MGTPIWDPQQYGDITAADEIPFGPPQHPSLEVYRSRIGNRIKLRTFSNIHVDMGINERYESWSNLFWQVKNFTRNTEYWDDLWYWTSCAALPSTSNYITMIACDLDANTYCAVTLRNGRTWDVFASRNTVDPVVLREGYENRQKWSYVIGGSRLEFDLWNPINGQRGWTGNDMIISWGLP